jgi:hypothetical protein
MTAGTQRSGVCACAKSGISNATTAAARFKLASGGLIGNSYLLLGSQ